MTDLDATCNKTRDRGGRTWAALAAALLSDPGEGCKCIGSLTHAIISHRSSGASTSESQALVKSKTASRSSALQYVRTAASCPRHHRSVAGTARYAE